MSWWSCSAKAIVSGIAINYGTAVGERPPHRGRRHVELLALDRHSSTFCACERCTVEVIRSVSVDAT